MSDPRVYGACAVVLLYAAFSIYFLWIAPRRGTTRATDASFESGTLVAFASQTGFAEQVAIGTAELLRSAGAPVQLCALSQLDREQISRVQTILFVVSTTGEGDAPDSADAFARRVLTSETSLPHLNYAVLALGDRSYSHFCAFGHRLDGWLRQRGALPIFDLVEVDNGDIGALRHWQHQLSVIAGNPDVADWEVPRYERWRISQRTLVNPGSVGGACFHIELQLVDGTPTWHAGDILEIDPHNSTWSEDPARAPHPHREYSIASVPSDGAVHLLVREMRRPDGSIGLGSGWLTQVPIGSEIAARIRPNRNFHAPADDRPVILIGNGTGIAGLRGLLKARIAADRRRNWLIFGERNRATDGFYACELQAWRAAGVLEKLDLVFSRDHTPKQYVQHRVLDSSADVRAWVDAGAAIYVCGSLQGMAPAVHAALEQILGRDSLDLLAEEGRYKRDVY